MLDLNGKARAPGSTLSLGATLQSYGVHPPSTPHNAGNDAVMCLFALQLLLQPEGCKIPTPTRPEMNYALRADSTAVLLPNPAVGHSYGARTHDFDPQVKVARPLAATGATSQQQRPLPTRHESAPLVDQHGQLTVKADKRSRRNVKSAVIEGKLSNLSIV